MTVKTGRLWPAINNQPNSGYSSDHQGHKYLSYIIVASLQEEIFWPKVCMPTWHDWPNGRYLHRRAHVIKHFPTICVRVCVLPAHATAKQVRTRLWVDRWVDVWLWPVGRGRSSSASRLGWIGGTRPHKSRRSCSSQHRSKVLWAQRIDHRRERKRRLVCCCVCTPSVSKRSLHFVAGDVSQDSGWLWR